MRINTWESSLREINCTYKDLLIWEDKLPCFWTYRKERVVELRHRGTPMVSHSRQLSHWLPIEKVSRFLGRAIWCANPPLVSWVIHTDILYLVFSSWTEREHSSLGFPVSSPWTATSWLELSGWGNMQGTFSTWPFLFSLYLGIWKTNHSLLMVILLSSFVFPER